MITNNIISIRKMEIIKFQICDKVIILQEEDKELANLLRNDDAFTAQFFEKAVREGRLQQFGILSNEIDNFEIIRLEEETTVYNHYGDTEMNTETMPRVESRFEDSRDIVGPVSTEEVDKVNSWNATSTKLLLNLYMEHLKKVGKSPNLKNKKSLWKLICEEMAQQGYNFSPRQVENRYKTLDRGYKDKTVNNKKTGRNRASCEFQRELDEIYADNRAVYPEYILGSSGCGQTCDEIKKKSSISTENVASSSSHEQIPISNEAHDRGTTKRKHKSRTILDEIKQLRLIRENELEFKKQKERERKKFRSELLQIEREKLDAYKERNNLFKNQL